TMDDDAGAMSAWYIFAACGFSPAAVGSPVYYLNVPLFENVSFELPKGKTFQVHVDNYVDNHVYVWKVTLNGKVINRLWITHEEIMNGGKLVIEAAAEPNKTLGINNKWVSELDLL
ncbi:MAG: glycoside hydrolase family 92 protein, partial [Pedobacter sp.]|nr:glycoside hydrolase family 92 protein [Pedobacter sp.]